MYDWRLNGQEEYLSNAVLYRVCFPDFWELAYKNKNAFFQAIETSAKQFVQSTGQGQEYLEDEKIQHFWHEHCSFCWGKAMTDKTCIFYCTEDMRYWICEECYRDFCQQFNWRIKPTEVLLGKLN